MINLQNARVLLVDDSYDEALPVIKAFAKNGISVAYFEGDLEGLPKEDQKLKGVRLAILDMDLIGGVDEKSKISALMGVLQAILATDNGPYTMIAWTKHSELIDLLEESLFASSVESGGKPIIPLPVVSIKLEKKDFKTGAGTFDVEKLTSAIQVELSTLLSWNIMQSWETKCLRAGITLTNNMCNLVTASGDTLSEWREAWNRQYLGILVSLAREEIGEGNLNKDTFMEALFGALNPLFIDLLETNQFPSPDLPDDIGAITQTREVNPSASIINTRIHLSFENTDKFRPGNIYKLSDCDGIFPVDARNIFENLRQSAPERKTIEELFSQVIPVIVEVSASCDFAQNKIKLAKFVAGMLISSSQKNKFKKPQGSIFITGPFKIEDVDRFILLSSQYIVTIEPERISSLQAYFRVRNQLLTSIQFWMAQQLSRPGTILLK